MIKILLVEDDETLGFVVADNLLQEGYEVHLQKDGKRGWEAFSQEPYDVCLLDVMLPEMDGFALAEKIRSTGSQVPVIFLTAKSLPEDRIRGFKLGGDDYLTKPFSMEELTLRIEAILRRMDAKAVTNQGLTLGAYQLDLKNQRLIYGASFINLTAREADLLKMLAERPNEIIPREEILSRLWGKSDYFLGRSLDVFISRLRKYLSQDKNLRLVSVHGVGFRIEF
ncbi:DNA-binding response regulator [Siphonobacter sp. SORGH_AS_0500]|uniref:response regulator transcription factor n=1 Tax=Siphonobacter sp. SORGH_AS_0500 TaxID=1864824 RepID=UPI000CB37859|nr:response regulator transcription factor [Siphonobacter sp. SORGH_AS_0500]PKK36083.1 DNA-binding response regulator [Siphonobacter sp. SORGH_AS_0500]